MRQKKNKRAENISNDEDKTSKACEHLVLLLRRISRSEKIFQNCLICFKQSYFRGVRIFCTAVYCLWVEK